MKRNIIYSAIILMFLIIAPISHAVQINVDEIIWQPDPSLDPLSLSAQVELTGIDAEIAVDLNESVGVDNWDDFFSTIDSSDVVVSFGSPTAPITEPATMLLVGSGLIGLAGLRRKFRKG